MTPNFDGVYQDVLVKGELVHKGRECQQRLDLILPHAEERDMVLDIGSHSGYFAIELARQRKCLVDSFEADPHLRQIQRWAIKQNMQTFSVLLFGAFAPASVHGNHYDDVLMLSVLHYFPRGFLEEVSACGSRFFIEFPYPEETEALYHDLILELSPFDEYLRTIFGHVELLGEPPAPYMPGVKRGLWLCEK